MSFDTSKPSLPTLDRLQSAVRSDVDAHAIATKWLEGLSDLLEAHVGQRDEQPDPLNSLFLSDATWRDTLAMTWDYRTIQGLDRITALLKECASSSGISVDPSAVATDPFRSPALQSPFPDLTWIQFGFDIETSAGRGQGYARLVPTSDASWKAYTVWTSLESLSDFSPPPMHKEILEPDWTERRAREVEFADRDPVVLILGAGHSGLELAARLQQLQVPTLIVERNPRVGDNWRNRYDALCTHDPFRYNELPYVPFPATWPMYSPKNKMAGWIEAYAEFLELNIWTSSTIKSAAWSKDTKMWSAAIVRGDGTTRTVESKHLVFANGFGGGKPQMPVIPGKDTYKGVVFHSSTFHSARGFEGKKAIVVGACNSAHDIAQEFCLRGSDITMFQRSSTYITSRKAALASIGALYNENSPPVDIADRLAASFSNGVSFLMGQRGTAALAATIDKEIHERLKAVGFRLNFGPEGAGALPLFLDRGGGYYVDTGASQLIAEKKIKLKVGGEIERFTSSGLKFTDGTILDVDVVVFATGFGNAREIADEILESGVAEQIKPVWGLDSEGEVRSVWRYSGHPQVYFAIGNFAMSRLYSHYLALQIKAQELGIYNRRFSHYI